MVSVTPEGLWMVSCRIVDFRFFIKFHRSGPSENFQLLNYHGVHYLFITKAPSQAKDLINIVSVTPEGLCMVSCRIVDFSIFRQISQVRTCKNFQFLNYHGAH